MQLDRTTPAAVPIAREAFERAFGVTPAGVAFAPGRVNLIGEHTDYNEGFVLPMAIADGIAAAFAPNQDGVLRVHAFDLGETREVRIDALGEQPLEGWMRYPAGIAATLKSRGEPVVATTLALASTLPSAAGLSSSAAVELSTARVLAAVAGTPWRPREAAVMAQHAEHSHAGVACGVMDQMAVACGEAGHALLIDCRSLETRNLPLSHGAQVVIVYSGVPRSLTGSDYNERRAACERAVEAVRQLEPGVRALRDVDAGLLQRARDRMDAVAFQRASHVVVENTRPLQFASAMQQNDLPQAGRLMLESHASLRDLYEVSRTELDLLVTLASAEPGCYGARLTGAGFGGCIVALVAPEAVRRFSESVASSYRTRTGLTPRVIVSEPSAGARLI